MPRLLPVSKNCPTITQQTCLNHASHCSSLGCISEHAGTNYKSDVGGKLSVDFQKF